jgi:hypothetical protein
MLKSNSERGSISYYILKIKKHENKLKVWVRTNMLSYKRKSRQHTQETGLSRVNPLGLFLNNNEW